MRFLILTTVLTFALVESRRLQPFSSGRPYSRGLRSGFSSRSLNEFGGSANNFIYRGPSTTTDIIPFRLTSSSAPQARFEISPQLGRPRRDFQSFDFSPFRRARSFGHRNNGYGASSNFISSGSFSPGYGTKAACRDGEVLHFDGTCVEPIVTNNVFVYEAPYEEEEIAPEPYIPQPELRRNIIFIRTPESSGSPDPIVVPQNQEQTIVYVLTEKQEAEQQVVHIQDAPELKPEVYYVNYNEGENPVLPNGVDLRTALASANANLGQVGGASTGIRGGGAVNAGYSAPAPAPAPVSPPASQYS